MRKFSLVFLLFAAFAIAAPKKLIHPQGFPKGTPFSPGILADGTLYVAGQLGRDLKTQAFPAEFEAEVKQTLENIGLILKEAGMGFEDVVTVNVYLTDMELFQRMNSVYTKYFPEPRPARTTVGVTRLGGTARVEITVTARK